MKEQELNDPTLKGKTVKEKKRELEKRKNIEKLAIEDRISHLERMEKEDEKDPLNAVFQARENFKGPLKDRKRTNKRWLWVVLCLTGFFIIHGFTCNYLHKITRFWRRRAISTLQWPRLQKQAMWR